MSQTDAGDQGALEPGGPVSLAKVVSVSGASLTVAGPRFGRAAARLAAAGYRPRAGDAVLTVQAEDSARYVIGVVRALRDAAEPEGEVRASDGAAARLERGAAGEERLVLRDREGRLLVTHHADTGRTELHAPGDLALRAEGDLSLEAEGRVRVRAGTDLELEGRSDVRLRATDEAGATRSELSMREGRARLEAESLGASIDRADLSVRELDLVTRALRTVAGRVKSDVERLEVRAGQIVERARETFRETEGLSQTRAGRLRLVAEKSLTALADKALLKARDDVKIKGDRIHLA